MDKSELSTATNIFAQGTSREGYYRSLVLDQEYHQLENEVHPVKDSGAKFAARIAQVFFKDNVNFDSYLEVNSYRLKRRIAERALEVVDTMAVSKNQLYYWYALISVELAKELQLKKATLRTSQNAEEHFKWAKEIPLQHLKGELVIKIHQVLNRFSK